MAHDEKLHGHAVALANRLRAKGIKVHVGERTKKHIAEHLYAANKMKAEEMIVLHPKHYANRHIVKRNLSTGEEQVIPMGHVTGTEEA